MDAPARGLGAPRQHCPDCNFSPQIGVLGLDAPAIADDAIRRLDVAKYSGRLNGELTPFMPAADRRLEMTVGCCRQATFGA